MQRVAKKHSAVSTQHEGKSGTEGRASRWFTTNETWLRKERKAARLDECWKPKAKSQKPNSYFTSANIRTGPPAPPSTLSGATTTVAPDSGTAPRFATFSR